MTVSWNCLIYYLCGPFHPTASLTAGRNRSTSHAMALAMTVERRTRCRSIRWRHRQCATSQKAWDARDVDCDQCGLTLAASSLASHLESQHGIFKAEYLAEEYLEDRPERTFRAHVSADGTIRCPVPGCVGEASSKWNMCRHFRDRHPLDIVSLPGEGAYPRCTNCGLQSDPLRFGRGHERTALCREGGVKLRHRQARVRAALSLRRQFTADGDALERVEVFLYLGRLLSQDDSDAQVVRANLVKAHGIWARVGKVLKGENAPPRMCGKFYVAIVQSVLLYGSETWNLTPSLLRRLEGFHIRCCYRMARRKRPRRGPKGVWKYPDSAEVLKECGLQTMEEYILGRRATIAAWVVDRPLLAACKDGERMRGTPHRQWWWEQEMSLEEDPSDSEYSSDGESSWGSYSSWGSVGDG